MPHYALTIGMLSVLQGHADRVDLVWHMLDLVLFLCVGPHMLCRQTSASLCTQLHVLKVPATAVFKFAFKGKSLMGLPCGHTPQAAPQGHGATSRAHTLTVDANTTAPCLLAMLPCWAVLIPHQESLGGHTICCVVTTCSPAAQTPRSTVVVSTNASLELCVDLIILNAATCLPFSPKHSCGRADRYRLERTNENDIITLVQCNAMRCTVAPLDARIADTPLRLCTLQGSIDFSTFAHGRQAL